MSEITLTSENFEAEVLQSEMPVMVDFWATWCGPCKMLGPVLSRFAENNADKVKVGKVNVDEQPDLASQYGISSIPTVMVFKNGTVTEMSVGYKTEEQLAALL